MNKSRWKVIRTERIIESLNEAALQKLRSETERGFPGTPARQNSQDPVRVVNKTYTPYVQTGNLLIESLVDNQARQYNPEIFFDRVDFEQEESGGTVSFVGTDGETYFIKPISFAGDNAKVRCTCLDFFYRFAHTNFKVKSLYGELPPPYQRKTTTYPPANPMKVPGLCKHLIALVDELQREGIVS